MPASTNTNSNKSNAGKQHGGRVLDLSSGARTGDDSRPADDTMFDIDPPRPLSMSVKAQREARFQARNGDQGRYDEDLDVAVDGSDIHEVLGEDFANRNDQRVMKSAGTRASKATPTHQSKPRSIRTHK